MTVYRLYTRLPCRCYENRKRKPTSSTSSFLSKRYIRIVNWELLRISAACGASNSPKMSIHLVTTYLYLHHHRNRNFLVTLTRIPEITHTCLIWMHPHQPTQFYDLTSFHYAAWRHNPFLTSTIIRISQSMTVVSFPQFIHFKWVINNSFPYISKAVTNFPFAVVLHCRA